MNLFETKIVFRNRCEPTLIYYNTRHGAYTLRHSDSRMRVDWIQFSMIFFYGICDLLEEFFFYLFIYSRVLFLAFLSFLLFQLRDDIEMRNDLLYGCLIFSKKNCTLLLFLFTNPVYFIHFFFSECFGCFFFAFIC